MSEPKDELFKIDHLKSGLKDRAVRSASFTLAAQAVKLVLQIGSITIMARLLQPSDFGLVAMVTVFTGLALQMMEGGLSMATIQRENVTHAQVSNLFWANAGLGLGACLLAAVAAPLVAALYNEPRLVLIMLAMSLTFLVGGLSVQHDAILRRQMRFRAISLIDIASMIVGITVGIISAVCGLGYWALIASPIATFLSRTLLRWVCVGWVPSAIQRNTGVRPLLSFGANLTGANFIGYAASNITPFAIGYLGGAYSLGLYNRANTLASIPSSQLLPPIINVLQPTISRVANDRERLRAALVSLLGKIALLSVFITGALVLFAGWIIELFLGADWQAAVPFLQLLSLFSVVQPMAGLIAVALIAVGEGRAMMVSKLHSLAITFFAILIGSSWGVVGVVAAFSLSGLLLRLPLFSYYAGKFLPVRLSDLAKALLPGLVSVAISTVSVVYLKSIIDFDGALAGLMTLFPIFLLIYLAACLMFPRARRDLLEALAAARLLVSGWMA